MNLSHTVGDIRRFINAYVADGLGDLELELIKVTGHVPRT
jgi:hypothetical protein